MTNIVYEWL
jgi:hypothetical protein